nr:MAG TPA: hypothetical protein [Caudoviricetes sp.]
MMWGFIFRCQDKNSLIKGVLNYTIIQIYFFIKK